MRRALLIVGVLCATGRADVLVTEHVDVETYEPGKNEVTKEAFVAAVPKLYSCFKTERDVGFELELAKGKVVKATVTTDDAKQTKCAKALLSKLKLPAAKTTLKAAGTIFIKEKKVGELVAIKRLDSADTGDQAAAINKTIKASSKELGACYQDALKRDATFGGKFVYQIEIEASGKVTSVKPTAPTTKSKRLLDTCMAERLKKLTFPVKAKSTVNYPFIFQSS